MICIKKVMVITIILMSLIRKLHNSNNNAINDIIKPTSAKNINININKHLIISILIIIIMLIIITTTTKNNLDNNKVNASKYDDDSNKLLINIRIVYNHTLMLIKMR